MINARSWIAIGSLAFTLSTQAVDFETFSANMRQHHLLGGKFVQEKTISGFPKPLTSHGQFTFWLGHGVEWATTAPLTSKTWLTSNAITVKNQFGQQSITNQTHPMIGVVGSLMMSLFTADMRVLNEHFNTSLESRSSGWRLVLTPKSDMSRTLFNELTIRGSDFPQTISIAEKSGDTTRIRFERIQPLKQIPEGLQHAR